MCDNINIVGCGYIGLKIALQLQQQNLNVTAYVKSGNTLNLCRLNNVRAIQFDLDDLINDVLIEKELVIYLVPPQPEGDEDLRLKHFLIAIESAPPKKIVLISTTGVYGDCAGDWVNEDSPINPVVARAKRRADAERKIMNYCKVHNISFVILRVPGIYGEGKMPIKRISSGEPIVREQDSPYSNRIHAEDLVSICIQAALSEAITGIYNCSDGQPSTMCDYFMKVADAFQLKRPVTISLQQAQQELSAGMLSYMAESRRVDNKKLLRDFNLTLKYPDLESGLKCINKGLLE